MAASGWGAGPPSTRAPRIASQAYAPLNYPSGAVSFAPAVQSACERVLSCSGEIPDAGEGN